VQACFLTHGDLIHAYRRINKLDKFLCNIFFSVQEQLYKNTGMFWRPTVAIQADVGSTVVAIAEVLGKGFQCSSEWIEQLGQGELAVFCEQMKEGSL